VKTRLHVLSACAGFILFAATIGRAEALPAQTNSPLKQGDAITLGDRAAVLTKLDTLPFVDSEYSRRYRFDTFDNPRLKLLRERYHLDEVIAPGKTEFDRQVLLLDWVNHRFKKFGKPSTPAKGALDILSAVDKGDSFFCTQYGEVMVSAAASLGWVDRPLALRRPDNRWHGATEHTSTEIWSNQYGKWLLFDPTFSMYVEKDGKPLSAYEFRQEWFYRDAADVTFVQDKDRKRYKKSDMPVLRGRYPGFGDLTFDPGATDVYAFIGYIPNTDVLDKGYDYGRMFITKDKICDGTQWHHRTNPANPATDPYFPINQAAVTLTTDGSLLHVALKTLTPNFKTYQIRFDDGVWKPATDSFTWAPHVGANRLAARSVNQFGVEGPISTADVEMKAGK
jgi:hypothetical protein